ncbi:ribonuclease H-like domain-containing protein [Tanacetum coccineum]|uniref:Ribonuclease H-like domain-containing protein n=1 Tax=Tanacetum coccineum TaxID=301880 RepID=A0ABQ5CRF5_9ASTR
MVIHFRVKTNRPTQRLNLHVSYVSPLSKSYRDAFNDPNHGTYTAYLLLYVDDIVITAFSETLLHQIISSLHQEFSMTYLGSLNYFLGISVTRDSFGIFLSQRKYATEILERAGMVSCNSSRTPVDTKSKLGDDSDPVYDLTLYRSLAGSLQYLTFTSPDISYALHCFPPLLQIWLLIQMRIRLVFLLLGDRLQLRNLLRELHTPLSSATLGYCDNVSAVFFSSNTVQHQCTKHIEIDIHFVRDLVAVGQVYIVDWGVGLTGVGPMFWNGGCPIPQSVSANPIVLVKLKLVQEVPLFNKDELNPKVELTKSNTRKLSSIWNVHIMIACSLVTPPSTKAKHATSFVTFLMELAVEIVHLFPSWRLKSISGTFILTWVLLVKVLKQRPKGATGFA